MAFGFTWEEYVVRTDSGYRLWGELDIVGEVKNETLL
jgi:hypothetical protein